MTANHRKDALEVAHITGVQGIRAAMARLADEEADVPLPGDVTEEVPLGRRTCAVCARGGTYSRRLSREGRGRALAPLFQERIMAIMGKSTRGRGECARSKATFSRECHESLQPP